MLLTSGPDYRPNSQELSRLTYFASNHPGKLTKLGQDLEKRVRQEIKKARAGNTRSRASLLISLAILRGLATECRRDVSLLSPSLLASVNIAITELPNDLQVLARAAEVFSAWTTYTDGQVIGTDRATTESYLSSLRQFSALSSNDTKSDDKEVRNRSRLIGLAALTGALNSEALHNDVNQFSSQVKAMINPLLVTILEVQISTLDEQALAVKQAPASPYLAEFRQRPTIERRAASIHLHIDGDKGPSTEEVSRACLLALHSLLEHANGYQLGHIMKASLDALDELSAWSKPDHCCWFVQKTSEWSQYQYRYAVPTWLVERLLESQDVPKVTLQQGALAEMIATVFNSSTPLINLSTSDIVANLITLLLKRTTIDPEDELLPALVRCIASLGTHVYYSDQIQDLAAELINRLVIVEVQGVIPRGSKEQSRSQSLRTLLAGLLGLMKTAERNESPKDGDGNAIGIIRKKSTTIGAPPLLPLSPMITTPTQEDPMHARASRRTRVAPDTWQDTLSLLCDRDYAVRADYADGLMYYLSSEMPKQGDATDADGIRRVNALSEGPTQQAANLNAVLNGDFGTKILNAIHAYLFILASSGSLESASSSSTPARAASVNGQMTSVPVVHVQPATPSGEVPTAPAPATAQNQHQHPARRSVSLSPAPRARKLSAVQRLIEKLPTTVTESASASALDYANVLAVLTTTHEQMPVRALLTGVPMLLALDGLTRVGAVANELAVSCRIHAIREVVARVWMCIGTTWNSAELIGVAEQALSSMPYSVLPSRPLSEVGEYHPPREPVGFQADGASVSWMGVDPETALMAIVSIQEVQKVTGLDRQALLRRFSYKWTADLALKDSIDRTAHDVGPARTDAAVSHLLKISPALMHIENLSLQSLARSTRGVGVTDLREALEGRSGMSNPALVRPASISTLDHGASSLGTATGDGGSGFLGLTPTRSRTKKRAASTNPGEVRDVLNRLGIGKPNGGVLKASFPGVTEISQKERADQRIVS